jgi:hypothetical protein
VLAERGEVLRGVKAVSERGDGGLEGAVGDGDLERGKRIEDLCGVLCFDIAERPSGAGAELLEQTADGQPGGDVGRGAESDRGGLLRASALVITTKQREVVDRWRRAGPSLGK